jgi:hypothetical protein
MNLRPISGAAALGALLALAACGSPSNPDARPGDTGVRTDGAADVTSADTVVADTVVADTGVGGDTGVDPDIGAENFTAETES